MTNVDQLSKNFNKTQNRLIDLNDLVAQESAKFKPIEWFQIKHECEKPGLIINITPDETSTKEWNSWETDLCMSDARNNCITIYNSTKIMPYFSIYKTANNKFKWAIFKISDNDFNNKAIISEDYSKIEIQQGNLELNLNFEKSNFHLKLSKHNIDIPAHYNLNNINFSCIETIKKEEPDCNKIKQSKIDACEMDKARAVVENEKNIERKLLADAGKLLEEGYGNSSEFINASKEINNYIKGGETNKDNLNNAINSYQDFNRTITNILTIPDFIHYGNHKDKLLDKQNSKLKQEKQLLLSEEENIQNDINRNTNLIANYDSKQNTYNKLANNYEKQVDIAMKNSNKQITKRKQICKPECKSKRKWFRKTKQCKDKCTTSDVLDTNATADNNKKYKKIAEIYYKKQINSEDLASQYSNNKQYYIDENNELKYDLERAKYVVNKLENFNNNIPTCNNNLVDTTFKIHNANHDCNSEEDIQYYPGVNYTITRLVDTPRSSQLSSNLISDYNANPGSLNASVFVNEAGVCNNNSNIKNQRIHINYSINHKKEDIKISKLIIENRNNKPNGNGMLFYNINNDNFEYIMNNRSKNNNNVNIRIMDNGNLMMNDEIIINNPETNSNKHIVNGYSVSNNKTTLKSGDEIRNQKYRLVLGNDYNGHTLFYNLTNSRGNAGIRNGIKNKFKFTESYHKTNKSSEINIFILYKIKTYGLDANQVFLYEDRIYANIEPHDVSSCNKDNKDKNPCIIRAVSADIVADIQFNGTNQNINLRSIPIKTMDIFNDVRFKYKTIDNNTLVNVDSNINDIRLALIMSLYNIHKIMQDVKNNGVQGFTGRYEGFSNYSTIEGATIRTDGVHSDFEESSIVKQNLDLIDTIKDDDAKVQAKYVTIKNNYNEIKSKVNNISNNNTNDNYDNEFNIIPFMFDTSSAATDFYNTEGSLDPRAKIDALEEDSKEMLYQQKILYTIGSLTSATFLITAILLARNAH